MSTNPSDTIGGGPVTRAQRAAAGVANPTPPSVVNPSVPVLQPLPAAENEEKRLHESDDVTESEADLLRFSELDEYSSFQLQEAQLDARLKEMELIALKKRVRAKQQALEAAHAEFDAEAKIPPPSVVVKTTALSVGSSSAVNQTPARQSLRPRMLAFQSAVGRKAPTAAALLYKAGVDSLPDLANDGGSITGVSEMKETVPPIAEVLERAPFSSHSRPHIRPVQPEKFSGDDATQNERIERWVRAVNAWLDLSEVPAHRHLAYARSLVLTSSGADEWLGQKDDELLYEGKAMTWEWLQGQLIQHYGQPSGALAMAAEWQALRMGVKNVDGSETGGKATWTVLAYTTLFLKYMRHLTPHSVQTQEIVIIDRYVAGIKSGYDALYKVMLGVQRVLWFDTLKEAMDAAEIAEVTLTVSRLDKRTERSASSSSSSSSSGSGRGYRGKRPSTETLNNVEGNTREEGQGGGRCVGLFCSYSFV
jgi:hypothetical protein